LGQYRHGSPAVLSALSADGSARFSGGFQFLSPLRWAYDSGAGDLSLTIPRLRRGDERMITRYFVGDGRFVEFDSSKRRVVSRITPEPNGFFFMNYYMYQADSLDDVDYAAARQRCPELPAR
jgi:hypothetical protein